MREGLYDSLLTARLAKALEALDGVTALSHALDETDAPARLARFLAEEVRRLLGDLHGEERVAKQAILVNELLAWLQERASGEGTDTVASPAQVLLAIHSTAEPPVRPFTPLATSTLLIRPGKPDLGHELAAEFASSDRVDALVSFVTWSGFRRLRRTLEAHASAGRPLRLITTTYTGATEAAAIQEIAKLTGAEVKVSFDGRRTRIHAKAWLFHRETGFSSVWVGSANLSASALAGGLEWTMKASEADLRHVVEMFRGSFDSLWEDPEFERIDPTNEDQHETARTRAPERKRRVRARGSPRAALRPAPLPLPGGDPRAARRGARRPRPPLQPGRRRHRHRQDHAGRLRLRAPARPSDAPLPRPSRGAPAPGAHQLPTHPPRRQLRRAANRRRQAQGHGAPLCDHPELPQQRPGRPQRRRLRRHRRGPPRAGRLVPGRPGPPEAEDPARPHRDPRAHRQPVASARLRRRHRRRDAPLARAREAARRPLRVLRVADETDFSAIEWRRGGYDAKELDNLLTGNDRRAELIAEQFRKYRGAWRQARALAFCTSVRHAEFMAARLNAYGIPSIVVHGDTARADRTAATQRLAAREVNVLFTCDLFNEGIDLPFVDTLLFLRPTSSATVFLQQMGRGLRLSPDKSSCLILDFVGQHRREFRFDDVLSAVTGTPRGRLAKEVEAEFPTLPAGCVIQLDRVAKERILESLRRVLRGGEQRLAAELRAAGPMTLAAFLEHTGRSLEQVYDAGGMTHLRRPAGHLPAADDRSLNRRFGRLLHIDDPARLAVLRNPRAAEPLEQLMLGYQLFHETTDLFEPKTWLDRLNPDLLTELAELADALTPHAHAVETQRFVPEWPLHLHRRYDRREVQTACGDMTTQRRRNHREGVLRLTDLKTELFFVTLDKSEGGFSPTTSYRDYAISRDHFHWETQNSAAEDTPTGRRYIQQAENGWRFLLFVRETPDDAFVALGPVEYVSHTGERPMGITWELDVPMPAALFERFAALLAA